MPRSIVRFPQKMREQGGEEGAKYVSVKIPKELMDEVDKIVSAGFLGYRSRMEFIKDAVRDKVLRLRAEVGGERSDKSRGV